MGATNKSQRRKAEAALAGRRRLLIVQTVNRVPAAERFLEAAGGRKGMEKERFVEGAGS